MGDLRNDEAIEKRFSLGPGSMYQKEYTSDRASFGRS